VASARPEIVRARRRQDPTRVPVSGCGRGVHARVMTQRRRGVRCPGPCIGRLGGSGGGLEERQSVSGADGSATGRSSMDTTASCSLGIAVYVLSSWLGLPRPSQHQRGGPACFSRWGFLYRRTAPSRPLLRAKHRSLPVYAPGCSTTSSNVARLLSQCRPPGAKADHIATCTTARCKRCVSSSGFAA